MADMKMSAPNGVKVYNVAGGKSLPEWLSEKKREALRKDEQFRRRVELIQELEFPVSSSRVKVSADGNFLVVTGIHPPQVKVYELSQLALKFERHLLSEIIDFQILTEDYSKLVFACADRSLVFHAKFGGYFSTRLPKAPRSVAYHAPSGDVLAVGSSSDVYRLNLELGRFMSPLPSGSPGLNVARVSPAHGLLAAGGEDGALECFDVRRPVAVTRLENATSGGGGVTCLRFDGSGTTVALGSQAGKVLLYDLRSSRPLLVKDHRYSTPIVDVKWHSGPDEKRRIISSCARSVKVWDAETGTPFTSLETESDVTDTCIWPGSGLILMATEAKRLVPCFVPALGPAPRWCAFLENLTEEMEEHEQTALYDDYRFVTRADLERLGLGSTIGTALLRPYMHGFFIDNRLYGKAAALVTPFDYAKFRAAKAQEKLEGERGSRIARQRKLPKVNAALAARLAATGEGDAGDSEGEEGGAEEEGQAGAHKAPKAASLLTDQRFAAMFSDADFEVDEMDAEYRQLHPHAPRALVHEHYEEDEDEENGGGAEPRMYVSRGEEAAAAFAARKSLAGVKAKPLGERRHEKPAGGGANERKRGRQEMTFELKGGRSAKGRGGRGRGRDGGGRGRGRGRD